MTFRRTVSIVLAMWLAVGLLAVAPTPSLAWARVGVFVGPAVVVGPPVVVAPPVYAAPPSVIVETPPTVYQEQPQQQASQYWYYCQEPQGYYPYVSQCQKGWQQVSPSPAPVR